MKRVAVIGAGASGLAAVKSCLEEGLTPVCFDKKSDLGGVWKFEETPREGFPSVMYSTVSNTSKEGLCFSDFPYPDHVSNFNHHTKVLDYLKSYAKHFDLDKHIHFEEEAVSIVQTDDFSRTGRWTVTVRNVKTGESKSEVFDGVLVCNGHHAKTLTPEIPGSDDFKGQQIHSLAFRSSAGFEKKRVMVVGYSNTAGDVAVELSHVCKQVFMSTRKRAWIYPRIVDGGLTAEYAIMRRMIYALPLYIRNILFERKLKSIFDVSMYGLKPDFSAVSQQPFFNDHLPALIASGRVIVTPGIRSMTKTGVIFDDGTSEDDIDAIVYATGYYMDHSFIKHPSYAVDDNHRVNLYRLVFAPDVKPHTLALVGCIQPYGSVFPIVELQARWAAAVLKGAKTLPSEFEMRQEIKARHRQILKLYGNQPRYTTTVECIEYMDEMAEQIGCKPDLVRLFFSDPWLAITIFFGPCVPFQFRLAGRGSWSGARQAVFGSPERMRKGMRMRKDGIKEASIDLWSILLWIFAIAVVAYVLSWAWSS